MNPQAFECPICGGKVTIKTGYEWDITVSNKCRHLKDINANIIYRYSPEYKFYEISEIKFIPVFSEK